MKETWRPVVGYKGFYEVSSLGQVKSVARLTKRPGSIRGDARRKAILLKLHPNPKGYFTVKLSKGKGTQRTITVHRVVALAFIPNPKRKPQLNHLNGIKTDNRVSNIEWATNRENQLHAWAIGLQRRRPKYLVTCTDLGLIALGAEGMASLLRDTGYPTASSNGVQRSMSDGGTHLGMNFTCEEIDYAAR